MGTPLKFNQFHERMILKQLVRSCYNCDYFTDKDTDGKELCSLYKVRPPAKVIVFSCGESWVGEIPF